LSRCDDSEEPNPPSAEQVATVYRLLPSKHRLALLFLDWSGARVSAIDRTLVGDYDEARQRASSPSQEPTRCGRRSRRPAAPQRSRCSRRTTCATAVSRCSTCAAFPGRGSASGSASATWQ
jgi:hypothetical protein